MRYGDGLGNCTYASAAPGNPKSLVRPVFARPARPDTASLLSVARRLSLSVSHELRLEDGANRLGSRSHRT